MQRYKIMFNIQVRAAQASHTRLRQLADFPSLNLRSSFAKPSLRVYKKLTLKSFYLFKQMMNNF